MKGKELLVELTRQAKRKHADVDILENLFQNARKILRCWKRNMREEMCRQTEGWVFPAWMVAAERDDPVCQLFTVSKKPTINLQDAEDDNLQELGIDHIDAYDVYKDVQERRQAQPYGRCYLCWCFA